MEDDVDAFQRFPDGIGIADVAAGELDLGIEILGTPLLWTVDLGIGIVEDPDPLPALQQGVREVGSDESRRP